MSATAAPSALANQGSHVIGRSIGRYRIVARLGEGAMASVWRAEDTMLGRTVALKILAEALAQSPEARRRFVHEARAPQRLDHPAILPVYDHGEASGAAFIAMALVEGETLAERMSRGLVPVPEALRIARDVAAGLGFAHAHGVLHRDVTPRNIMLAKDGQVFLLDFGLALVEGFSRVTRSGGAVGTLLYMAPEALAGGPFDARSDLYGLGAVLYELLAGAPPHHGEQLESLMYDKMNRPPRPPSALRAEVGRDVDALVLKLLEREPARRFADAEALLVALRRLDHGAGAEAPHATTRRPELGDALATGTATAWVVVPRFEIEPREDAELTVMAGSLVETLRRRLGALQRVHVVQAPERGAGEDLRAWARRHGANLVLLGRARRAGARVRVDCTLLDPESGTALAGEAVDGTPLDPFDFEDRLLAAVRGMFPTLHETWLHDPIPRPEPAAEDRLAQALGYLQRHDHEPSVDAAIALLERLAAAPGAGAEIHAALGRALLAKYQLTLQHVWEGKAARAIERAMASDAVAPAVRLARADLEALAGHEAEALALYQSLVKDTPGLLEAWIGLAKLHREHSRFDEAESACRHAIAMRPNDWRGHNALGQVFAKAGRYADAIPPWRRVRDLVPGSALAARNLGFALYHLDRFEEATETFRESVAIEPTPWAYANLGTALYMLERFDEAAESFDRAVALRPEDAKLWGNLGNASRFIEGKQEHAAEALDRAIGLMRETLRRNPADAEGWALLAGWLETRGHPDGATEAMDRAIALAPGHPRTMVEAAHLRVQRGDPDGAMAWLARAVDAGYGVGELQRSRELRVLAGRDDFQRLIQRGDQNGRSPEIPQGRP